MNRILRRCGTLALLIALTGCSVGMAMSGKPDPNLGAFGVGSSRGQVEMQLGSPTTSTTLPDGTAWIYIAMRSAIPQAPPVRSVMASWTS